LGGVGGERLAGAGTVTTPLPGCKTSAAKEETKQQKSIDVGQDDDLQSEHEAAHSIGNYVLRTKPSKQANSFSCEEEMRLLSWFGVSGGRRMH